MSARIQYELSFFVGYDAVANLTASDNFERAVVQEACKMCGGCTTLDGTGHWCEDGTEKRMTFHATPEEEHVFILKLSCEVEKVDAVYEWMTGAIAAWAKWYNIDTDWVHVQKVETQAMHFSAKDHPILQDGQANLYRDIVSPGTRKGHGS